VAAEPAAIKLPGEAREKNHVKPGRGDEERRAQIGLAHDHQGRHRQEQRGDRVSRKRNDTSCRWKYRRSISGIAIFMNSEGWRLAKASGSHRRAPFLTSPNKATQASIRRTTTKAGIA